MTPSELDQKIEILSEQIRYEENPERLIAVARELEQLLSARLHQLKSKSLGEETSE